MPCVEGDVETFSIVRPNVHRPPAAARFIHEMQVHMHKKLLLMSFTIVQCT